MWIPMKALRLVPPIPKGFQRLAKAVTQGDEQLWEKATGTSPLRFVWGCGRLRAAVCRISVGTFRIQAVQGANGIRRFWPEVWDTT
jgi:hypothetical protein